MDKVVNLSSRKIESTSRIVLPNPKRNRSFFGGRGDFGCSRFSVGSQRNVQRTFLGKKSICKSNARSTRQSIPLAGQSVNPGEGRPFFSFCFLWESVHRNARCVGMVFAAYFIWPSATQCCD